MRARVERTVARMANMMPPRNREGRIEMSVRQRVESMKKSRVCWVRVLEEGMKLNGRSLEGRITAMSGRWMVLSLIVPLPAIRRFVSGRKAVINRSISAACMVRNQNIVRYPKS